MTITKRFSRNVGDSLFLLMRSTVVETRSPYLTKGVGSCFVLRRPGQSQGLHERFDYGSFRFDDVCGCLRRSFFFLFLGLFILTQKGGIIFFQVFEDPVKSFTQYYAVRSPTYRGPPTSSSPSS